MGERLSPVCRRVYSAIHIVSGFLTTLEASKAAVGKWRFMELPLLDNSSRFLPKQKPALGGDDSLS